MGILGFGGKNNKDKTTVNSAEQVEVSEARKKLTDLIEKLNELKSHEVMTAMKRSAEAYEAVKAEQLSALEKTKKTLEEKKANIFDWSEYEEKLYMVGDDIQGYINDIGAVTKKLEEYSAAEMVISGADKIYDNLAEVIVKLQDALEGGKKLQANVCLNIIKSAIHIAYKKPSTTKPENIEKIINNRIKVFDDKKISLIDTIEQVYVHAEAIRKLNNSNSTNYKEYAKLRKKMAEMPPKYREEVYKLGYNGAMEKMKPGSPLYEYLPTIQQYKSISTQLKNDAQEILGHKTNLVNKYEDAKKQNLQFEKEVLSVDSIFDENEHMEIMEGITQTQYNEISKMYQSAVKSFKMSEAESSKLSALANNKELGVAISNAMEDIDEMNAIIDENESFMKEWEKQQEILKAQEEAEKERTIEEQNEHNQDKIMADNG